MDADRARSAPPRRDEDDPVRRARAVQRRRRRPAQHVDRGDVRDVEVVEAGRHLTSDVESVGIRALICAHAVHVQERRVGHEQARGAAIEQARARADRARALHHHEPGDAPREQLGQRGRGIRGGERVDLEVAHAVAQLDRAPLRGRQGDGTLETGTTAAVLLRRQSPGAAREQRPGDERQPRLRHSRKRARPGGPGKRGTVGWRGGTVRRYRAGGATMTSFFKTTEMYRQGARTLPGRYYTSPEIFAEEAERIFARRWVCVGRAAELPEPGDYFLADVAGESVIVRSEEHTSELQSLAYLVCRLLLEKKKNITLL